MKPKGLRTFGLLAKTKETLELGREVLKEFAQVSMKYFVYVKNYEHGSGAKVMSSCLTNLIWAKLIL